MWTVFPPSDYYGASAPSRDPQSATHLPCRRIGYPATGRPGMVPTFTCHRSSREAPSFAPAASPRLRRRHSTWPPHRPLRSGFGVRCDQFRSTLCTAARPISARFEPVQVLRDFRHWFTYVVPSGLVCRTHRAWQCHGVPALSGLLSALTVVPRIRLPPTSIKLLRQFDGGGLSPPRERQAPRGARSGT